MVLFKRFYHTVSMATLPLYKSSGQKTGSSQSTIWFLSVYPVYPVWVTQMNAGTHFWACAQKIPLWFHQISRCAYQWGKVGFLKKNVPGSHAECGWIHQWRVSSISRVGATLGRLDQTPLYPKNRITRKEHHSEQNGPWKLVRSRKTFFLAPDHCCSEFT